MDKFKLVKELSKELTSTLELEELAHVINDFAVVHLGAAHSSIVLESGKYSYNNEDREVLNGIEAGIFKYTMKVRKVLRILNPKSEYMFKDIDDIDLFDKSIISFPLVTKNQALGSLNLYFEALPGDEIVDFLNLFAELSASSIMNSLSYRTLEAKSVTDKLTGLCNRRNFDIEIKSRIEKCSESGTPVSVMMIDIDNFKEYNDRKGHQEGDKVLEEIGKTLCSFEDKGCKAFRYGGEEIAVVASGLKPESAFEKAEQIRKKVEESGKTTISIGIVTCLNSSCPASSMVSEADKALYKAKKAGKNRVHSSIIIDKAINPIDVQKASELGRKR
jgi:diguanylate cyclase (GGDEF)-like protein